ncbi:MAG: TauD/TfdA family dioxygenase, partial [Alphaproteobacteria bacterium]
GEVPEGRQPWAEVPVFMPHDGKVVSHYVRSAIRKGQDLPGAPPLTEIQIEALDLVDAIAGEPDVHLDMDFRPGDIQLVCNHWTWHSRTAFEDWPEPERRRHLLRLWLACADGPSLPRWMTDSYEGATADGRPNGIEVPGVPFVAPL